MNYSEQTRFVRRFRAAAGISAAVVALLLGRALWLSAATLGAYTTVVLAILGLALVHGLVYMPLYLRMSVERRKWYTWTVRARFVLVGLAAVTALPVLSSLVGLGLWAVAVGIAAASVAASRLALKRNPDAVRFEAIPLLLLVGDLIVLLLAAGGPSATVSTVPPLVGLALVSLLFVLVTEGWYHTIAVGLATLEVIVIAGLVGGSGSAVDDWSLFALPFVVIGSGSMLVRIVDRQHERNVDEMVEELSEFAIVTREHALDMLASATGILARNWNEQPPTEPEAVARWYEENSEYYLYDLAQFHLAYKHISFMRDVVGLARGRVLDFGAGIGDLILDLSRRGHDAVYLDVDGRTKAFAEWRAERNWLPVQFASDLDEVDGLFDTIVSLDVFEHLAEPEPVIDALVDRLAPGGRMIVTAYFGATKAHPMHFDHDLDLAAFLRSRGLQDDKSFRLRYLQSEFMGKPGVLVFRNPTGG